MGGAFWKEFYLNILSKLWCSSKILFKQLRWHGFYPLIKRQSKIAKNRTACLIKNHPDRDLKNIALRAGWKGLKGLFLFYWGSMRPFFIEGFSCFGTKQIWMDGEQMGELALIIWNPSMQINKRKSRFLIWLFLIIKLGDHPDGDFRL